MKTRSVFAMVVTLVVIGTAAARDHRVEALKQAAPADEVSPEVAATLSETGVTIVRGTSTTLCHIWFCKQWPVKPGFEPTAEVLYPFEPGQLIGVVQFERKSSDFRDQDIDSGVYTLRYAQQPIDGNHVGTSPTRDFFLLVSAAKDKSAKPLDKDALISGSAAAAQSTHPAMLCLQRPADEKAAETSLRHNETHDWWVLNFTGKAKAGEKVADLPIDLVIVGVSAE